jgi:predicted nucleotide-binding protein
MSPDEMQQLLESHNIGFAAKDMAHGRQFRLSDGAIANVYNSGKVMWQGKDTANVAKIKGLCGEGATPIIATGTAQNETVYVANNKVFIVYGHDIAAREQLELLLRRMKLEPVILQNLPIAGDTIIEKLEIPSSILLLLPMFGDDDRV